MMKTALYCRKTLDTANAIVQKFLNEQYKVEAKLSRVPTVMMADLRTLGRNKDVPMLVAMITVLVTSDSLSPPEREQILMKMLQ